MLARLWNYRPTAASYEGSEAKTGSMRGSFYGYKEKLILNENEAFKADDVTKSYDIGFLWVMAVSKGTQGRSQTSEQDEANLGPRRREPLVGSEDKPPTPPPQENFKSKGSGMLF